LGKSLGNTVCHCPLVILQLESSLGDIEWQSINYTLLATYFAVCCIYILSTTSQKEKMACGVENSKPCSVFGKSSFKSHLGVLVLVYEMGDQSLKLILGNHLSNLILVFWSWYMKWEIKV